MAACRYATRYFIFRVLPLRPPPADLLLLSRAVPGQAGERQRDEGFAFLLRRQRPAPQGVGILLERSNSPRAPRHHGATRGREYALLSFIRPPSSNHMIAFDSSSSSGHITPFSVPSPPLRADLHCLLSISEDRVVTGSNSSFLCTSPLLRCLPYMPSLSAASGAKRSIARCSYGLQLCTIEGLSSLTSCWPTTASRCDVSSP